MPLTGTYEDEEHGFHIEWTAEEHVLNFKLFKHWNSARDDGPEMSGFLKWDGCLNFTCGSENRMAHICEAAQLKRWVDAVYALGPKMEAWDF